MKNKTKSKVVNLIPVDIVKGIEDFKLTKSFPGFLEVLKLVAITRTRCEFVFECWNTYKDEVSNEGMLPVFLDWISILRFPLEEQVVDKVNIFDEASEIKNKDLKDLAKLMAESYSSPSSFDKNRDKVIDPEYPYGAFMAAWPLVDLLSNHPEIDEAARLISEYINGNLKTEKYKSIFTNIKVKQPGFSNYIKNDLLPWVLKNNIIPNAYHTLIDFFIKNTSHSNPDVLSNEFPWYEIRATQHGFTPSFYGAFIEDVFYCLSENNYEVPDIQMDQFKNLLNDLICNKNLTAEEFNTLTCIYVWSEIKIDKMVLQCAIDNLIAKRRQCSAGQSSIDFDLGWGIRENVSRLIYDEDFDAYQHDIAYLIVPTDPDELGSLGGFSFDGLWKGDCFSYLGNIHAGIVRKNVYALVFDCAINEGWYEFANATLAFFLFSQPLFCENELHIYDDWPNFSKKLLKASKLPGFHRVQAAARFAIDYLSEKEGYRKIDVLNLGGWALKTSSNEQNISLENPVPTYQKIQNELIECLGDSVWNKMDPFTKRCLQGAEKKWSELHSHLGRGMDGWGGLALDYIKIIEMDLSNRLTPLLNTQEYKNYKRSQARSGGQPTLGSLIHILINFNKLPTSLKQQVRNSGVKLYDDRVLLDQLSDLLRIRNQAAHDKFEASNIIELRGFLYDKGFLKNYFSSKNSMR